MKFTLDGRVEYIDRVPFISKLECDEGFVLYNEKGEHFVFATETQPLCCEAFKYNAPIELFTIPFTDDVMHEVFKNGCEIEVFKKYIRKVDTDITRLDAEIPDYLWGIIYNGYEIYGEGDHVVIVKITDLSNGIEYYGYAALDNTLYIHKVVYGLNGELVWDKVDVTV